MKNWDYSWKSPFLLTANFTWRFPGPEQCRTFESAFCRQPRKDIFRTDRCTQRTLSIQKFCDCLVYWTIFLCYLGRCALFGVKLGIGEPMTACLKVQTKFQQLCLSTSFFAASFNNCQCVPCFNYSVNLIISLLCFSQSLQLWGSSFSFTQPGNTDWQQQFNHIEITVAVGQSAGDAEAV